MLGLLRTGEDLAGLTLGLFLATLFGLLLMLLRCGLLTCLTGLLLMLLAGLLLMLLAGLLLAPRLLRLPLLTLVPTLRLLDAPRGGL